MKNALLLLLIVTVCAGCNTVSTIEGSRIKGEPFELEKALKLSKPAVERKEGSIWKGEQNANSLFYDLRAKQIGDIVMVRIVEVSQASEKATTDTGRQSEIDAGIPNFFGQELNPTWRPYANPATLLKANTKNNFAGTGETTRSGSLSATITAKVVELLPNGNLAIEGKREIFVNNEKKEILLQGVIRQKDVAADNSVLSTQVADAKVIYTGIGLIGEKQRPGWAARLFDLVWPF
jgi:flagellar L-ring protein precursor FlgH